MEETLTSAPGAPGDDLLGGADLSVLLQFSSLRLYYSYLAVYLFFVGVC